MIVLPPMSSARYDMTSGKNWRVLLGKDDRDQKQQECDGTKERKLREINFLVYARFAVIPVFLIVLETEYPP